MSLQLVAANHSHLLATICSNHLVWKWSCLVDSFKFFTRNAPQPSDLFVDSNYYLCRNFKEIQSSKVEKFKKNKNLRKFLVFSEKKTLTGCGWAPEKKNNIFSFLYNKSEGSSGVKIDRSKSQLGRVLNIQNIQKLFKYFGDHQINLL